MSQGSTLVDIYRAEGVRRVKIGFTDIDGVMRGKYLSLDKFASIADGTSGFCDCVFGWDVDDQLYDNARYTRVAYSVSRCDLSHRFVFGTSTGG